MNARALDQLFGKESSHTIGESLIPLNPVFCWNRKISTVLYLCSKNFEDIYKGVHFSKVGNLQQAVWLTDELPERCFLAF